MLGQVASQQDLACLDIDERLEHFMADLAAEHNRPAKAEAGRVHRQPGHMRISLVCKSGGLKLLMLLRIVLLDIDQRDLGELFPQVSGCCFQGLFGGERRCFLQQGSLRGPCVGSLDWLG